MFRTAARSQLERTPRDHSIHGSSNIWSQYIPVRTVNTDGDLQGSEADFHTFSTTNADPVPDMFNEYMANQAIFGAATSFDSLEVC